MSHWLSKELLDLVVLVSELDIRATSSSVRNCFVRMVPWFISYWTSNIIFSHVLRFSKHCSQLSWQPGNMSCFNSCFLTTAIKVFILSTLDTRFWPSDSSMTLTERTTWGSILFLFTLGPLGVKVIALELINSCTLYLKTLQFLIVYLGAPEWNSYLAFTSELGGRGFGGGPSLSKMNQKVVEKMSKWSKESVRYPIGII